MERKISVVEDLNENKIVVIHDIIFKGKRSIEWEDVEAYLKRFVGKEYIIESTGDAEDEKMYLYDIMNIKKETSTLFQS